MTSPNLSTDIPALAIVIDRLEHLSRDFNDHRNESKEAVQEHRKETKDQIDELQKEFRGELADVKSFMSDMKKNITMAKGGYLVLLGLGGMAASLLGFWDRIVRVLHA